MSLHWLNHGPDDVASVPPGSRLATFSPIREYQPLADRKAAALLAGNGLVVSVTLFFAARIDAATRAAPGPVAWAIVAALVALGLLVLAGGWMAFRALITTWDPAPETLASYSNIAARTLEQYVAEMRTFTYRRAVRELLHYNHAVARACAAKFWWVNRSVACFRVTMGLWMALLAAVAVWG